MLVTSHSVLVEVTETTAEIPPDNDGDEPDEEDDGQRIEHCPRLFEKCQRCQMDRGKLAMCQRCAKLSRKDHIYQKNLCTL